MEGIKIVVIIPTYNRAHLISRAINSVVNQTFSDWELIVVDDGSTDNTAEILKPFLAEDKRIRYVQKENTGAAHSRNVGVENSNHQYITFLDSDDEAKREWLENINQEIKTSTPDLICCGCEKINHHGEVIGMDLPKKGSLFGSLEYKMTGGVFIIKRELFNKVGGYDNELTFGEHTELSFRVIPYIKNSNGTIVNIYNSLIKIHIHFGERLSKNWEMKFRGGSYCLKKHAAFFEERPKMKSLYAGIIAYNASKLGLKKEALFYSKLAFSAKPSLKKLLRIIRYIIH